MKEKISVILPAFNELENLQLLIPAVSSSLSDWDYEILIVDDNSTDGTKEFLSSLSDPRLRYRIRSNLKGLASAIADGIKNTHGDIIVIMDSDFNHNPEDLKFMIHGMTTADFVTGSRFLKGARSDYPVRTFLSRLFNYFLRFCLSSRFTDHLFGYCILRRKVLGHLEGHKVFYGFGEYYMRLLYYLEKANVAIAECPVNHRKRFSGYGNRKLFKTAVCYFFAVMQLSTRKAT